MGMHYFSRINLEFAYSTDVVATEVDGIQAVSASYAKPRQAALMMAGLLVLPNHHIILCNRGSLVPLVNIEATEMDVLIFKGP